MPYLDQEELKAPLHLKKPARIGVQFMGDLFHKDVPWEFQIKIFESMASAGKHTYFILTKRPEQMRKFFQGCEDWDPSEWPHLWLGVSVEDQKTANERILILLQIPAAHRWVSIEPMLGPINLEGYFYHKSFHLRSLNWIVVGGETGPHARPMEIEWARDVISQCKAAGVPVFVKQLSGKDGKDMNKWPEDLRIREMP